MCAFEFRPATRIEPGASQNLEVLELVNPAQKALNCKEGLDTHFSDGEKMAVLNMPVIRWQSSNGFQCHRH